MRTTPSGHIEDRLTSSFGCRTGWRRWVFRHSERDWGRFALERRTAMLTELESFRGLASAACANHHTTLLWSRLYRSRRGTRRRNRSRHRLQR